MVRVSTTNPPSPPPLPIKKSANIYGLGSFNNKIAEYWNIASSLIIQLSKKHKKIDICLDDVHNKVDPLNGAIENKEIGLMYQYAGITTPFLNNNQYKSVEFLSFLDKLRMLNLSGKKIRLFGIAPIASLYDPPPSVKIDMSLIQQLFPNEDLDFAQNYSINNSKGRTRLEFAFDFVNLIKATRKNKIVIFAHNDFVKRLRLGKFTGGTKKKIFKDDFLAIAVTGKKGNIGKNEFRDIGSLSKYIETVLGKDIYEKKNHIVINSKKYLNNKLSFYREPYLNMHKSNEYENKKNYDYVDGFDYVINIPDVSSTTDITLEYL